VLVSVYIVEQNVKALSSFCIFKVAQKYIFL